MSYTNECIIKHYPVIRATDGMLAELCLVKQDTHYEDGSNEVYTTYFAAVIPTNTYSGLFTKKGSWWRDRLEQCGDYICHSCYVSQEQLWLYHTYADIKSVDQFNEDLMESKGWVALDKIAV